MQTGDTRKIRELLQKTEHYDADERFMATNDLIKELEKVEGFLDNSLQEPVRNAVLKQLDDKGKDVSTIAVKALSTLVQKFNPEQVTVIVQKLGKNIVAPGGAEEDSSRDVFVDGLRNVIAVIDDTNGKAFASDLLKTLLTGLRDGSKAHANISRMCMDVVKDILERFGGDVIEQHADLMKALTKLLNAEHPGVSQCASVTLGPLLGYLDEKEFNNFMLNVIIKNISGDRPDVYIQTVGVVCRAAGNRIGEYLPRIVPPLRKYCEQEAETPEATVVLWQECLQAFEFIILRCPNKVTEYISGIVALSLRLINYDPNFVQQVQGMEEGGDDDGWGDDDGDDAGWGDDDDAAAGAGWGDDEDPVPTANTADESWKVRLAAVGVISAFIRTRSDILKDYYAPLCDTLIARFSERDASVQEEVLLACRSLLNESVVMENGKKAGGAQDMEDDEPNVPTLVRQRSSAAALISKVPTAP
jgi:cullin-associated NEDD8-dissociated protein 1